MTEKDFHLVYYINFGYPSMSKSQEMIRFYAQSGAHYFQLDLPSRNPDPALEHKFILDRMKSALSICDDINCYLEAIQQVKKELPEIEIEMTVYEDSVAEVGVEIFCAFCKETGITRVSWIPDRRGSNPALLRYMRANGLKILHPILYFLPEEQVQEAVSYEEPVVFMLAGGNGEPPRVGCETLASALQYLRKCGVKNPIYATMGIKTPERVAIIKEQGADGAYIGSCLFNAWDNLSELGQLIQAFETIAAI